MQTLILNILRDATYAAMAQSVERRLAKAKVASSILVSRSKGTYSKLEMVKETIYKIVLNGFKSLLCLDPAQ